MTDDRFDPASARAEREETRAKRAAAGATRAVPAGPYLFGIPWFERRVADSGGRFLRVRLDIISGPHAGRAVWVNLSTNLERHGTRVRWGLLSDALGVTEPFDIRSDEEIRPVLIGGAFKGILSVRARGNLGQYEENDLERIIVTIRDDERAELDAWRQAFKDRPAPTPFGDDPGPSDGGAG